MRVEGIVRVSRVKGREGDSFVSPREQAERITSWCESQGGHLNRIHEELDVSGGATLERRPGLSRALEAVEAGRADVIAVAYFDRLFRSLKVQAEVAVQNMKVPRGRKPRSDRLLARLGVLRCGTCGARMVVATNNHSRYWVYRCPPTGDCSRRQAISATIVEKVVADRVREVIAGEEGHADVAGRGREVRAGLERAQADLDAAIRVFDGFHEVAAVERLRELQAVRDEWRAKVDHLGGEVLPGFTVTGGDWDRLTLGERRGLVRATVERVVVGSGRGAGRVTVVLFE